MTERDRFTKTNVALQKVPRVFLGSRGLNTNPKPRRSTHTSRTRRHREISLYSRERSLYTDKYRFTKRASGPPREPGAVEPSSGSNVIPRRARPGLAGLGPHIGDSRAKWGVGGFARERGVRVLRSVLAIDCEDRVMAPTSFRGGLVLLSVLTLRGARGVAGLDSAHVGAIGLALEPLAW